MAKSRLMACRDRCGPGKSTAAPAIWPKQATGLECGGKCPRQDPLRNRRSSSGCATRRSSRPTCSAKASGSRSPSRASDRTVDRDAERHLAPVRRFLQMVGNELRAGGLRQPDSPWRRLPGRGPVCAAQLLPPSAAGPLARVQGTRRNRAGPPRARDGGAQRRRRVVRTHVQQSRVAGQRAPWISR